MKGKGRDFPPSSQGKGNMPSRDQKWSLGRPGTCGGSWDPGAGQGSGGGGWDLGLGLDWGGPGLGGGGGWDLYGGGGWDLWRRRLGSGEGPGLRGGGGGWRPRWAGREWLPAHRLPLFGAGSGRS